MHNPLCYKTLGHNDCNICGMSFYGSNGRRNFENHMRKHFPKPKNTICDYCNKDYKFKSQLDCHLKTCKMKNKLEFPHSKRKSRKENKEFSTATWILKEEESEKPQKMYEKKFKKELSISSMKREKPDTSQITAEVTTKLPEFILPNIPLLSETTS